jgi:hypothetical protein
MIPYIINVGLIVAGCLAFYKIFLQKETFYRLNRSVLLMCLAVAFTLPLIPVPQQWSLRKTEAQVSNSPSLGIRQAIQTKHFPSAYRNNPVSPDVLEAQPEATSPLSRQSVVSNSEPGLSFSQFIKWIIWLYWFGVIVFGLNFLAQFGLLMWRAYTNPVIFDGKFRIVEMSGDQAPCSFMNNIFINPEKYDWETYNQILAHEKVHIREKHSIDILLAELVLIFQWFNPFAWVYRKEIENNLEFLTDNKVLQNGNLEICSYQMSLLKVSAAHLPLSLTTNYNQSLLKKRIAMMNAKKSSLNTSWKYFFLIPMLALFACLLNEPAVQAQTKSPASPKNTNTNKSTQSATNSKSATNTKQAQSTKNAQNANNSVNKNDVKVVDVKVNKNSNKNNHEEHDGDLQTEGYWFATIKGDKIQFQFSQTAEQNKHNFSGSSFSLNDFPSLPKVADADFKLTREAGTMNFNGRFEGNEGKGKYKFVSDKPYSDYMNRELEEKVDDEDMMVFFMLDIKKSHVELYNAEGYTKLDKDNLISFVALNVDKEFLDGLKANGFTNIDPDELVGARAMSITGEYIKEVRDAGYKDITLEQLVSFKAMGIDKAYLSKVSKMKSGGKELDADDVVSLKAMGVDDQYADQFKQVGYTDISHEDLISMKAVGVTPEFIKGFKSMGYEKTSVEDFISMKSLNVTPEFLKSFQAIGYKQIDAEELVSLKALDVTPSFVKGFNDIGYKNIPIEQVVSLKATGITPAYVKTMKAKGFNYSNLEKYITLKSLADSD